MASSTILMLRRKNGLTQEELAEKAGLTVRTIQRIESNETAPRAYTLKRIAEALGVSPDQLLDAEPTSAPPAEKQALFLLNMSCFFYLVIPWVHTLIPYRLWKKDKSETGWAIVKSQVWWTIALNGLLLLALGYNLLLSEYFKQSRFLVNYLWLFLGMYLLNAFIILRMNYRIMTGKCRV